MACRSESSTCPLLTSHRSAPRGSCSPQGSCDPGTCRRWRPSGRWKRSCSRLSRPGSGSPSCWKGTPPAAGSAGRPALRFHAEMGWRNRRPEAGDRRQSDLSPHDPSPACFCHSTHDTRSGSQESQAGEDGESVSGFCSFYPRGMAMAPGTHITVPVSSLVPGGQPLCTRLLPASSQTPGLLCQPTFLIKKRKPQPPAMTTQGHSLVPGTVGGLSKHQPSMCPASILLLPEVHAQRALSWQPAPNPHCCSMLLGLSRLWFPCHKFPSLTICGAETSIPPDTDPCIFLPCSPSPAQAGFHRSWVISVLPAITHCPSRFAGLGGPPGEDSDLLIIG